MTPLSARILDYAIERVPKAIIPPGVIAHSDPIYVPSEEFASAFGAKNFQDLDRQLDHLRAIGVFSDRSGLRAPPLANGAETGPAVVVISVSSLGFHLFVRCQGSRQTAIEFFGLEPKKTS